jgi:hypothetical protein
MIPDIGSEVVYTPHDARHDPVTGFVAWPVQGAFGDTGCEILVPGGPFRLVRTWASRGNYVPSGRRAWWAIAPPQAAPPAPAPEGRPEVRPYRDPADLAALYRSQGLTRQRAWAQFIKDTVLQPRYRSGPCDARGFFRLYDRAHARPWTNEAPEGGGR